MFPQCTNKFCKSSTFYILFTRWSTCDSMIFLTSTFPLPINLIFKTFWRKSNKTPVNCWSNNWLLTFVYTHRTFKVRLPLFSENFPFNLISLKQIIKFRNKSQSTNLKFYHLMVVYNSFFSQSLSYCTALKFN